MSSSTISLEREDVTMSEYVFSKEFKHDFFEEPDDWEYESLRPLWSNYMFWTAVGLVLGLPFVFTGFCLMFIIPDAPEIGRRVAIVGFLSIGAGFGTWVILIPYRLQKHIRLWWEQRNDNGGDA
jgi:hypothetical protein